MEDIKKYFTIKDDKYGSPDTYLGSNNEKVQLDKWIVCMEHA
jgi:hypothetical protein